jgi:tetratricopeptide (TPR) repeat protein
MRHPPFLSRFPTLRHLCCKLRRAVIGFCTFALLVSAAPIQAGAQDLLSQFLGPLFGPRILDSPRRPRSPRGVTAPRTGDFGFSMEQCGNSKEPAVKVDHCSFVISHSSDPKILERAFNRRGLAYMSLNRFAEAANDFTAVIRRNPRIAGYFDNRQNAYRGMGRLNEALNDANRAVRLAPTYAFVYGGRGTVFAEMGRYDLAIEDYTKAISLDSRNAGLFAGRGKISATAGQLNDAIADFTHALDMDRNMTVALRERGLAYQLLGNFDAARSDLSLFLRLQPNDREIVQALQDMPTLPEGRSGALPKTDEGSPPRVGSTPELESKMRIEKRDRLVSAAKQLIDEASAFIQADPRNPKTLDFADQIRLLNRR